MEPDYIITETGVPDILLRRSGMKFGVTQVRKFQHKKENCKSDESRNVKDLKNLQNERLKNRIEEARKQTIEEGRNLERLRHQSSASLTLNEPKLLRHRVSVSNINPDTCNYLPNPS